MCIRDRKNRKRIQESRENHGEFKIPKITNAERQRIYRQRLKDKEINTEVESTPWRPELITIVTSK